MFEVESLILTALISLAVGIAIGAIMRRSGRSVKHTKNLELHLEAAKEELSNYQQDVTKHFMDTAQKVGELTQNYRDLNQHLADGAMHLASAEVTRDLIAAGKGKPEAESAVNASPTPVEPPKDWAPKVPGSHGMLSEEFGLKEAQTGAEAAPKSPPQSTPK